MLTSLSLSNFKAWKSIEQMRLARITGLFGSNSSGKSSVLQFLLMLKQTSDSADRNLVLHLGDDKSLVSLGTFTDVVHGHDPQAALGLSLSWSTQTSVDIKNPETEEQTLFRSSNLRFEAQVYGNGGGKIAVRSMSYALGDALFRFARKDDSSKFKLTAEAGDFEFKRADGRKWPLPPPVKFYGFADEVRTYHKNAGFLAELELQFERMLRSLSYLGPLRDYPRREYTWGGGDPADMGRRGEYAIAAVLASRERGSRIGRGRGKPQLTLEQYVAHWLKELGLIVEFRVEEITKGTNLYRVWVRKTSSSPEVLITDVGFGVSQVLPVLVLCYYVPEGSIILLEQPEIHLHPSVQSRLADVFIDAVKVRNVQIIVESHSEHLLRRLQRRIAESDAFTKDDAALYFCDVVDGAAQLTELDVDMYGDIHNWPTDFFGNEMEDLAAIVRAGRERRGRGST